MKPTRISSPIDSTVTDQHTRLSRAAQNPPLEKTHESSCVLPIFRARRFGAPLGVADRRDVLDLGGADALVEAEPPLPLGVRVAAAGEPEPEPRARRRPRELRSRDVAPRAADERRGEQRRRLARRERGEQREERRVGELGERPRRAEHDADRRVDVGVGEADRRVGAHKVAAQRVACAGVGPVVEDDEARRRLRRPPARLAPRGTPRSPPRGSRTALVRQRRRARLARRAADHRRRDAVPAAECTRCSPQTRARTSRARSPRPSARTAAAAARRGRRRAGCAYSSQCG